MSTVVLSLFGDEIIPEQINAVGKSRATRKPKAAAKKEEIEPEVIEGATEVRQEQSTAQVIASVPEENGLDELVVESDYQEALPLAEIVPESKQEAMIPSVEIKSPEPEVVFTPEITAPSATAPESKQEEIRSVVAVVPETIEVADQQASRGVTKTVRKPAVKKAKPAVKKAVVKKESVKKEKPEGHSILEGWTPDKQYYSIGEVASLFYVATSHIRFWTNEFALKVRTTRKGDRLYSPEQINELRTIYNLVKEKGYTIAGAKARLKEAKKTPVHTLDLKQSLLQLRNKLVDIKNQL